MRTALLAALLTALPALAELKVPEGFHVEAFARELGAPRTVLALEDGTVLVSRPDMNDVIALRDRDGDGRADEMRTAVASVEHAHGLAMRGRVLYVAGVKKIVASERQPDGSFSEPYDVVTDLPDGGQHPDRTIGAGPDGKLYVSIGSSCSDCMETNPEHASMLQVDANGANRRIFARGLRNTHGFDWDPATGELWGGESGEINRIGDGLHYGWPLCTGRNKLTPVKAEGIRQDKFCSASEPAALELGTRPAPAGFVFYRGTQFPEGFRRDAFAASGNEIVRVRTQDGVAESFISGFDGPLAGATVAADGSLLVSDAQHGTVYRVTYGETLPPPMISSGSEPSRAVLAKAFAVANLSAPESVVHDEEQDVYFVSNKGFISRVTPEGKIAELKFIDGLDAPKGMAIRNTELWIADGDRMRVFDRVTGAHLGTIELAEHGAVSLHDVAIGPDELVYVTDTDVKIKGTREQVRQGDGRVFRIGADGEAEIIMAGEELRSPTGIAWDGTRFLIAQAYGKEVLAWNPGTATKAVLRGPGAYDGMVVLPSGAVIVSSHHDDAVYVAHAGGELRPLFTRKPSPAGIGFDRKRNRLLIASTGGDWLEAWTLPPLDAPKRTSTKEGATEFARQ
jgi:glucose/arabinose dehydrogenase/sugar lactone lactonase YvrE